MGNCRRKSDSVDAPRIAWADDPGAHARANMLYPMYVVRVAEFMKMKSALPHQRLVSKGLASAHVGSYDVTIFISHQWCGTKHADPSFRQLRVLQSTFDSAAKSSLAIDIDVLSVVTFGSRTTLRKGDWRDVLSWSMWYDYFSVPQPDAPGIGSTERAWALGQLDKAVSSLWLYVESCAHFLVLAPYVMHEDGASLDYLSWKRRGWCRMERLARVLRCGDTCVFVVRRQNSVLEVGAQDYVFDPVGTGEFGCETDRARLAGIVRGLFLDKLNSHLSRRLITDYHSTLALRSALLEGMLAEGSETCHGLLARLQMSSESQAFSTTSALLLATRAGDVGAMETLIRSRASVDCIELHTLPAYCTLKGQRPIHAAVWHGHLAAVRFLLESGVSANARNSPRLSAPLHFAGTTGKPAMINLLLEHRAEIDARQDHGMSPLDLCISFSRPDGVKALLDAGPSCAPSDQGLSPLHAAAVFRAGRDIIESLLRARACPNSTYHPRSSSRVYYYCLAARLPYLLGKRDVFSTLGYHAWAATPLMFAVLSGSWPEARLLLERQADASARNGLGATASSLASLVKGGIDIELRSAIGIELRSAVEQGSPPRSSGRKFNAGGEEEQHG